MKWANISNGISSAARVQTINMIFIWLVKKVGRHAEICANKSIFEREKKTDEITNNALSLKDSVA